MTLHSPRCQQCFDHPDGYLLHVFSLQSAVFPRCSEAKAELATKTSVAIQAVTIDRSLFVHRIEFITESVPHMTQSQSVLIALRLILSGTIVARAQNELRTRGSGERGPERPTCVSTTLLCFVSVDSMIKSRSLVLQNYPEGEDVIPNYDRSLGPKLERLIQAIALNITSMWTRFPQCDFLAGERFQGD